MPIDPYLFGFDTRPGKFGPDSGARLVNAYVQEAPPGSQSPINIYCRPGLEAFSTIPSSGGFRGGLSLDNRGYFVIGPNVYRVISGGSAVDIGDFPGTGPAFMARNRRDDPHIAICSEGLRYLIETSPAADTVATIGDGDLGAAIHVFFCAGYFVWLLPSGVFQVSGLDDGTAYDPLDIASAEADPDGLVGGIARGTEAILFGTRTIQFYANIVDAGGFPFVPVVGATIPLGCVAADTIKAVSGVPVFVASDFTVRILDGYSPQRISTHEIEQEIDTLTPAERAGLRAWTFNHVGHAFYVLTSARWTYVIDLVTRSWYRWQSFGSERWCAAGMVEIGNVRVVGDYDEPRLYALSADAHDDAGDALVWSITGTPFGQFPHRVIVDQLYVNLIPGVGNAAVTDPEAMLRISDDDGHSWSDEMTAPMGRVGERKTDVSFTGLGASGEDGFRFELSVSAAVARALTGAAIRYTALRP